MRHRSERRCLSRSFAADRGLQPYLGRVLLAKLPSVRFFLFRFFFLCRFFLLFSFFLVFFFFFLGFFHLFFYFLGSFFHLFHLRL